MRNGLQPSWFGLVAAWHRSAVQHVPRLLFGTQLTCCKCGCWDCCVVIQGRATPVKSAQTTAGRFLFHFSNKKRKVEAYACTYATCND
eukprot:c36433_g1_i1 orf=73-336(-)